MGTRSLAWGASLICRSFSLGLLASQESPKLRSWRFINPADSAARAKEEKEEEQEGQEGKGEKQKKERGEEREEREC